MLLVIGRVIAGLAAGGVVPISFALVGDMIPVHERQVAMGRLLFAIMTGNLLGATCAGVVGDLVGWRGVFFVTGALGLAASIIAVPGFRGMSAATGTFDLSTMLPNYRAIFRNPLAKICFGTVFLEAVFMYGVFPYVATMLHEAGETRASIAGIVIAGFGIGGALYGVLVSRLLPLLGRAAHDAHRRRRARLLPAGDRGAALLAARVHEFRAARLRLLLSARGGADLRQRARAVRARLGHGAAFILFLSGAGDRADRLRRRALHHRLEPGAVDGRWRAGRVGFTCAHWLRRPSQMESDV